MEVVPTGITKKRQFLSFLLILLSKSSKNGKIGRLSVIPVGTTSIVIVGHFFGDPKGLNKFRWSRTKIRGTLYWELGVPNHPRNRWKWAKNDKNGSKSKFPRCPIFKFFVVTREVIPEKMPPILDSINFFGVLTLLGHSGACLPIVYVPVHIVMGMPMKVGMRMRVAITMGMKNT